MNTKQIVITGGLGFIGSNFANYLDKKLKNYQIIIFDKSKINKKKNEKYLKSKNNKFIIINSNTIKKERHKCTFHSKPSLLYFGFEYI